MATYNKRGYKAPKPKDEKEEVDAQQEVFEGHSTTAEVFDTLDEGANRAEEWVERNQKIIFGVIGAIALVIVGYMLYNRFVSEPAEDEAASDMFQAQKYYEEAVTSTTASDSLFTLALNGGEGKYGLLAIIDKYPGTDAANIANYCAGTAYLNLGKYKEAVQYLDEFKTEEPDLKASAKGAIGDAFAELGTEENLTNALKYYDEAVKAGDDFSKPRFLMKAGLIAMQLNKKEDALNYFQQIKDNYDGSAEAVGIDAYIARLK
ncbi:tetratricopeptide repeat protein [Flavobacterium rhizosphaerae]|uniref:Tetratricopeptide repeat protein n=1 Tax=Flavobacterium rhizosphaerae TaxID=3163298 RepID=A0ABW8Z2T7_9FLAO